MLIMAQFIIFLTLLVLAFVNVLLLMAIFCKVIRWINMRRPVSPKLIKYAEVLDWLKEEDDE